MRKAKKRKTAPPLLRKAKRLAKLRETQVWLLASPAEADQIAHGLVPLDIQQQAQSAIRYIVDEVMSCSNSEV